MSININGETRVLGIIGNPISHSLSPIIQNYFSSICNENIAYVPFFVEKNNLKSALDGALALGIQGLNVTVPFKQDVCSLIDDIDEDALQIGAVNTLVYTGSGYKGYNTDIYGLHQTFMSHNVNIEGKTVIIVGAGGSAHTAGIMAAKNKASKIIIVNRTEKNSICLAEHINKYYNVKIEVVDNDKVHIIETADILIQTTPVGMSSLRHQSPFVGIIIFSRVNTVLDIIYSPPETVLLKQAKDRGADIINGLEMLVYQAAKSFELWTDKIVDPNEIAGMVRYLT